MREETARLLYPRLEARVLARRGNLSDREYLAALGDGLPLLRLQYRNPHVVVDYSAVETIDRYLLAYFPHYVYTAGVALAHVPCAELVAAVRRGLNVVCIGGGPLPELVALVDRLLECGVHGGNVFVTTVDVNSTTWAVAVQDSIEISRALAPGLTIRVSSQRRDCTAPRAPLGPPLPACDIITVQNCLNEIGGSEHFDAHVLDIAQAVVRGGYVVVSDLTEYGVITGAIPRFEEALRRNGYRTLASFDQAAPEVRSPFALTVPPRSYYAFFGAQKDPQTDEVRFPEWRWPKRRIRFSTSASQRQ